MVDSTIFASRHWITGVGVVIPDRPDTVTGVQVAVKGFIETPADVYAVLGRFVRQVISSEEVPEADRAAVLAAIDLHVLFAWSDDERVGDNSEVLLLGRGYPVPGSLHSKDGKEFAWIDGLVRRSRVEVPAAYLPFWTLFDDRNAIPPKAALDRMADEFMNEELEDYLRASFGPGVSNMRTFLSDIFTDVFTELLRCEMLHVKGW